MSEIDQQIARGMHLAATLPEIMPEDAGERIKPVYDDLQASLRVPFVNLIFRSLANYPDYLVPAWQTLKPIVRSPAFEQAADDLRRSARLEQAPDGLSEGISVTDQLRAFNDTIHYVLPKLLLVVTLLDESRQTAGARSGDVTGAISIGVAPGAAKVDMVDPQNASGRVAKVLDAIKASHDYPLVPSYYRGLAQSPDLLEELWNQLKPLVGTAEYEAQKRELIHEASAKAGEFPITRDLNADVPSGTSKQIYALLAAFRRKFIPEMLIEAVAIKTILDGPEAAAESRFSVAA